MDFYLSIGGLSIRLSSPVTLVPEDSFAPFLQHNNPGIPDVQISFSRDFQLAPEITVPPSGEDFLLRYYCQGNSLICKTHVGISDPVVISVGSEDYSQWTCYLDREIVPPLNKLSTLIRMVPLHTILLKQNTLFLHASQIAVQGRGILFSAPSGTGKTTQAKLWNKHRGAKIICNDRTLVRNGFTYGYPADGSEPVYSSDVYPLGAIVLLKQSSQNRAFRLKPTVALTKLMPQVVLSACSPEIIRLASARLLDLISSYPVFQLECTPDEDAVACLETCLRQEGVIT